MSSFFFFGALILVNIILILPGWLIEKKKGNPNPGIFGIGPAGTVFWILLTVTGLGAQSLSNLIEIPIVTAAGVTFAYLTLFLPFFKKIKHPVSTAFGLILLFTLVLRLFIPLIPE